MKAQKPHPIRGKKKIGSRGSASLPLNVGPRRPLYAHLPPISFEDDFGDYLDFIDYPAIAADYCRKVISGQEVACLYVRNACKKYLLMLDMAASGKYGFTFSEAHACDFLAFFEELPLVEDNFRGVDHAELEPWQILVGCWIYGFRDARGFRYIKEVYLEIPRKHFKSGFATAIGLYDLRNPDLRSPLVLIGAAGIKQADRVFGPIKSIVELDEELREQFKLDATKDIISCAQNKGTIQKVTSIGEREDGWNPTTIILEELHAQKQDVYDVLKSAMGARGGQLLFQITTAGRQAYGLAWDNRRMAIEMLEGRSTNLRMMAIIFTVDAADLKDKERLLNDERIWAKANPMLGVSVDLDDVRMKADNAKVKPQERAEFYRTRLNIWTNAATRVLSSESWEKCYDPDLDEASLIGRSAYSATDLSIHNDLTATVRIYELENDEIAIFARFYLADDSPTLTSPNLHGMMTEWVEAGYIELTGAGSIDFRVVEKDVRDDHKRSRFLAIGFDPAFASQTMKNLEDDRLPVVAFKNTPVFMTAPMDDLVAKIQAKKVRHDGNPVMAWCVANVHGERKVNDTIMPKKDGADSENKIDGFVAMTMANGLRMNPEFAAKAKKPSVYEKRGLKGRRDERTEKQSA